MKKQERNWRVELSKYALKYLKRLEKKTSQRILNNLEELEKVENPILHKNVRPLAGKLRGFYRLRVGEFRIIFELDRTNKRIGVHLIVTHGDAY
ncbi:MAG: type II toxin-antitoxin system RelE/ParE family toxin [Candidatus Aminicenantes bacterium]|nr:MAG: type II toxin-antitoxin system RelE/ParE family toxin [Candidatus Aminicenantes bacterium]